MPISDTEDTIIATIRKNKRENLRVSLTRYERYDLISFRVYYQTDESEPERPGKAGFNIRIAAIPELIEALHDAEAEAVQRGLLEAAT